MTKYEKLYEQKQNFLRAAKKSTDKNMISLWKNRADVIQMKINNLTVAMAEQKI